MNEFSNKSSKSIGSPEVIDIIWEILLKIIILAAGISAFIFGVINGINSGFDLIKILYGFMWILAGVALFGVFFVIHCDKFLTKKAS
jgi:hypothetical protein